MAPPLGATSVAQRCGWPTGGVQLHVEGAKVWEGQQSCGPATLVKRARQGAGVPGVWSVSPTVPPPPRY